MLQRKADQFRIANLSKLPDINVGSLEEVMDKMQSELDNPDWQKIIFIPSGASQALSAREGVLEKDQVKHVMKGKK